MEKHFVRNRLQEISLKREDIAIIAVRPTRDPNVVQLVFAQNVERPGRVNLKARAMKGHQAFEGNTHRPIWETFTLDAIKEDLPELYAPAVECVEKGDYVPVMLLNPAYDGHPICVQLTETTVASKSDLKDLAQNLKSDGTNYLLKDGYGIFTRQLLTYVDTCNHHFEDHNSKTTDINEIDYEMVAVTPEERSASNAQTAQKEIV